MFLRVFVQNNVKLIMYKKYILIIRNSIFEILGYWDSSSNFTSCAMEKGYNWVNGSLFEFWVSEGDSPILSVQGKTECPFVHVETTTENSVLLESFTISRSTCIRVMSELSQSYIKINLP